MNNVDQGGTPWKHLSKEYLTSLTRSRLILISLNFPAAILETAAVLYSQYKTLFNVFETLSVGIFTMVYILRFWIHTEYPDFRHPNLRFGLAPSVIVDFAFFLPFYIPVWRLDLRMIRVVRLFRLFRLLKMGRYSRSVSTIQKVLKAKGE